MSLLSRINLSKEDPVFATLRRARAARLSGSDLASDPELEALKNRKDPAVMIAVANTLGEIGDEQAVEKLITILSDPNWGIRIRAADALGMIGGDRAMEALAVVVEADKGVERRHAAAALGEIGHANARVIDALMGALKDSDQHLRRSAGGALGKIGGELILERLAAALLSVDYQAYPARIAVVEALGETRDIRAVEPLATVFDDKKYQMRGFAARSLGKLGGAAVEPLLRFLHDDSSSVRRYIVVALGDCRDARAVAPLISAFKNEEDWHVRCGIAESLGSIGGDQAIEFLGAAIDDPDVRIRHSVIKGLQNSGDRRALVPLLIALTHDWRSTRKDAAEALRTFGRSAIRPLGRALKDSDAEVRKAAAESLGAVGGKQAVRLLGAALKDKIRWDIAIDPLEKIGEGAVEPLIAVLGGKNRWARKRAAEALGRIKDDRAIESLKDILYDDHWQVRRAAAGALTQLGQAVDDVPVPMSQAPQEGYEPLLVFYVQDPWNWVIGSDSASFVHYKSGLTIYQDNGSSTGYFAIQLVGAEQRDFVNAIPVALMKPLDGYDLSGGITDVRVFRFTVWDGEVMKRLRFASLPRPEISGKDGTLIDPKHPQVPEHALKLWQLVTTYENPQAEPWLPEKIEVMIWPFDHAKQDPVAWPSGWPDLDDLATIHRGGDSYSVYLPASRFDELKNISEGHVPVLLADRKWSIAYRFPIPSEMFIWAASSYD